LSETTSRDAERTLKKYREAARQRGHCPQVNDVQALKDRLAWLREKIGIAAVRLD
jgi:hypothetical protein